MDLHFTKMHGCGNDFIVVDDRSRVWDFDEDAVRLLCDRHFGIGADGLILVRPASAPGADLCMHYVNSDGSVAEMCGNGVRVFAKYVADRGLVPADAVAIETPAGIKRVEMLRGADGSVTLARVDMGRPALSPSAIPTTLEGEPVLHAPLETPAGTVRVSCVSMGNPHAVVWVDDVDDAPVLTLGPAIEEHPAFPRKTNVEFAQAVARDRVRVRVWERGVGETLACGTGACATVVAGVLGGELDEEATVELTGGDLLIAWLGRGSVAMTGPAEEVYAGVLAIPDED